MTQLNRLLTAAIWEDTALFVMARVLGVNGQPINQASVASVALKVFDVGDDNAETHSSAPVVADTVFDDLQTSDPRWTQDTTGYNFACVVPASAFPQGGNYRVEFIFAPVSGDRYPLVVDVTVEHLLSS